MNFQNTGFTMMLKAMGVDPQMIAAKGEELEQFAKAFALTVQKQMAEYDARLSRIENMLVLLVGKVDAQQGTILPAGDTSTAVAVIPTQETNGNGRHSTRAGGSNRTARTTRGN